VRRAAVEAVRESGDVSAASLLLPLLEYEVVRI
jgi:hypothetical protein